MSNQATRTQPCPGPGDRCDITSSNGVTRRTWHSCPTCHGSH
jgi:hypothetical protein